jgi:hypothetical protein
LDIVPIGDPTPLDQRFNLTGQIGPRNRNLDRVSVKLMHLVLDFEREVPVQRDGTFKFTGLPYGMYVIATMRTWEICDIRRHELGYGRTSVNITLEGTGCTP